MWWCSLTQCLKEVHVLLGVLVPTVGLQRMKETAWTKVGTAGKGCPAALKVVSRPCQRKRHFQIRVSYSIWDLLAMWWLWSIPRLLELLHLRWNSSSLRCLYICVNNYHCTKIQLRGSRLLQSGIWAHKNQQLSRFPHPNSLFSGLHKVEKSSGQRGTTWHRYH